MVGHHWGPAAFFFPGEGRRFCRQSMCPAKSPTKARSGPRPTDNVRVVVLFGDEKDDDTDFIAHALKAVVAAGPASRLQPPTTPVTAANTPSRSIQLAPGDAVCVGTGLRPKGTPVG